MSHLAALVPFIALLATCSSKPSSSDIASQDAPSSGGFLRQTPASSARPVLYGDFASNPNAERFINKMVSEQGFDRQALHNLLAQTQRLDGVLRLMDRQAPLHRGLPGRLAPGCATVKNSSRRTTYKTALRFGTRTRTP